MKKYYLLFVFFAVSLIVLSENLISKSDAHTNDSIFKITDGFISNNGQWNSEAQYLYHSNGIDFWLCNDAFYINKFNFEIDNFKYSPIMSGKEDEYTKIIKKKGTVIKFEFVGSDKMSPYIPEMPIEMKTNYFNGNNQKKWQTNVNSYSRLTRKDIYPGVSVVLSIENQIPRYDFILAPNADLKNIKMKFSGQTKICLTENKDRIEIKTGNGSVFTGKIFAYQDIEGIRKNVNCRFDMKKNVVSFKTGKYNRNYPLIIDPKIYTSYYGGTGDDEILSSVIDKDNNLIVTGWTTSTDLKTTTGSYDTLYHSGKDIFVSKYSLGKPDKSLIFTSYIGGTDDDIAYGVDVDQSGNIYITGESASANYPTISAAYSFIGGKRDVIVTKMNPDGNQLIYSTFIGGEGLDYAYAISVGISGAAYICGGTYSTSFPKTTSYDIDGNKGREEAFVLKLSPSGSAVNYSALLTTAGQEHGTAIVADESQSTVIMCGTTDNSRFYTNPNSGANRVYDRYFNGSIDGFITKFGTGGAFCEFSGFYGGPKDDYINTVYLDNDGSFFIAGKTNSDISMENPSPEATQFPIITNALAPDYLGGITDAFIAKFDKKGQSLIFSTYFGGSGEDSFTKIAKNKTTNTFYLTGYTSSSNYQILNDNASKSSGIDAVITEINTNGNEVYFSTVIGGTGDDYGNSIAIDKYEDIYVAGSTSSKNLPITNNALQSSFGGGIKDGFIYKYTFRTISLSKPAKGEEFCAGSVVKIQWSATNIQAGEKFTIQLSSDNGINWFDIANDVTGVEYDWNIPQYLTEDTNYTMRIVHPSGIFAVTSGKFSIISPPSILSIGSSTEKQTFCEGENVSFFVTATGKGKTYQWRKDNKAITGASDSLLELQNLTVGDGGVYDVEISGKCSPDTISRDFAVYVLPATKVTGNFDDLTVKSGKDAIFTVSSIGKNNTFEWQKNKNRIMGYTDSTFTISSVRKSDEGLYRCIVTGDCGTDTTREALLIVDTVNSINEDVLVPDISINTRQIGKTIIITLSSSKEQFVNLSIADNNGNRIELIYKGELGPEPKIIEYSMNSLNSGVYWFIAESGNDLKFKKEMFVK